MPSVGDRAQMFLSQFRPQPPSPSGPAYGNLSELGPFLKDAVAGSTQRNLQAPSSRAEMYQKYMSDQANKESVRNQLSSGPLSVGGYEYGASFPRPASFADQYPNLGGAQAEERQRDVQKPQYPGTVIPTSGPVQYNMRPGYFSAQ